MELYNNDCLEVMKDLSANSIDLLFCDLPYGQTSCKWDSKIDLTLFWKEVNRICKKECPMFFTTTTRFGVDLINSNPTNFRYDLVWVKSAPVGFLNAKKMPMRKHEMMYVFYRKLPHYDLTSHKHKFLESYVKSVNKDSSLNCYGEDAYNKEYIGKAREANVYEPPLPNSVIVFKSDSELYGKIDRPDFTDRKNGESRYDPPLPNSILEIKSEKGKHSTQKPVALMEWILKYYSKEGDLVLDPAMGSGSTGIACKLMGRRFIGIEKNEDIFKYAVERIHCAKSI